MIVVIVCDVRGGLGCGGIEGHGFGMQAGAAEDDAERVQCEGILWLEHGRCACGLQGSFAVEAGNVAARHLGEGSGVIGIEVQGAFEEFDGLGMVGVVCGEDAKQVIGLCRGRVRAKHVHADRMGRFVILGTKPLCGFLELSVAKSHHGNIFSRSVLF